MRERWYDRSKDELLSLLQTDGEKGLSLSEAAKRLKEDGKNVVNPVQKAPIRSYLLQVISDLSAILMLGVALLALVYRRDAGALVMLILLLVNYTLTVVSYIKAQKSLEEMGYRAQPTAKVTRNGKVTVIAAEEVVQGDILLLSLGDIVPCDARLLDSDDLRVLENELFDSERSSKKNAAFLRAGILKPEEAINMVYASTTVAQGRGRAVAVATGEDTLVCRMGKNKPVAACHRLDIVKELKKISSFLSALLLIPVFVLTLIELISGGKPIEVFLCALALAVAAIPEMYAAFAYSMVSFGTKWALKGEKKEKSSVFIKNPLSLPALGELDCLIAPLESFFVSERSKLSGIYDGKALRRLGEKKPEGETLRILRYGLVSTGIYGSVRLNQSNEESDNVYTQEQRAIIALAEKYGEYTRELDDMFPILDHRDRNENGSLFETTLVHYKGQDVVVLRGDPEEVIANCTSYCSGGKIYDMDAYASNELLGIAGTIIKDGCKPIAVATKNSNYNTLSRIVDCQSELTFEGFLALEKPMQPGAAKQILRLRDAGIRVIAYTEEENLENRYLARALGIVTQSGDCMRSSELPDMKEGIFGVRIKNCGLFEGFSGAQLRYTVGVLSEEYGMKIGFFAGSLDEFAPMKKAFVKFSEEEGKLLGRVSEKEREVHTPLLVKNDKAGRTAGCQALNHDADVILPKVSDDGNGGINSISRAIRAARFIYRNIGLMLFYLAFTGCMRLAMLLFSPSGELISPVQMLVSGLIFDFAAVFVLAFERPDHRFAAYLPRNGTVRSFLREILPAVGIGACVSSAAVLLSKYLLSRGILENAAQQRTFCFVQLLLLQTVMLLLLLRTSRAVLRDFKISVAGALWILLPIVFLTLSFLFGKVGELFLVSPIGVKPLLFACILPFLLLAAGLTARVIGNRKKK